MKVNVGFIIIIIITRIILECRTANNFENTEQGQKNSATRTQQCGSQGFVTTREKKPTEERGLFKVTHEVQRMMPLNLAQNHAAMLEVYYDQKVS